MRPSLQTPRDHEQGFALVMVLILSILLYVMIAELVTTARMSRFTGENDALVARMQNHMRYTLLQVEEMLLDDLESAGESGAMGASGMAGALPGMGGEGGEPGGGEDPGANADSSQDSWFEPQGFADGDLTTYVFVEDENRKFNILSLLSPDQEFARESKARFVRLIDYLREGTTYDLSGSDGERLAMHFIEWCKGQTRSQQMPRPPLKTDDPQAPEYTLPLHLDELRLLEGVTDELFYDFVIDGKLMLGLEWVLTVYTSLAYDPGDPDKLARQGRTTGGEPASPSGSAQPSPNENPLDVDPIDPGIRVNINTASRPVLRCLIPDGEMPNAVIEAMLRHRNEEAPEDEQEQAEENTSVLGEFDLGEKKKLNVFGAVQDLDSLPEFMNLGNPEVKERFYELTTTKAHVFTVHLASLFKRNEERRVFVMRRAAAVLVRAGEGEEARLIPLLGLEERQGLRVVPIDFPEQWEIDRLQMDEMDQFAREERRWNPYFLDFYMPEDQRGY